MVGYRNYSGPTEERSEKQSGMIYEAPELRHGLGRGVGISENVLLWFPWEPPECTPMVFWEK